MLNSGYLRSLPRSAQYAIALVTAVALLAGVYGRFKGLGIWPLGVDEFYISRSIDNLLRTGLPQFPCGGYYTRGVLYQYLVALLRVQGMSAEFAGRFISAVSSLAVLPAAYLLGCRVHGRTVGLLAVIVLAVSIWEIEMARFARMYAPFQAVFVWYLVFFLRYTLDRDRRALVAMVILSTVGILTWEGGVFLGLINMLPPLINHKNGKLRSADWLYLVGMALLLFLFILATRDLRGFATPPHLPGDSGEPEQAAVTLSTFIVSIRDGWWWFVLSLLPLGLAAGSLSWIWSLRHRRLAACGLLVVLLSATLHQFLACGAGLLLLLLLGLLEPRELATRSARLFWLAIIASGIFWLAFCFLTGIWNADVAAASTMPNKLMAVGHYLLGFPDILGEVVRPWGRVLPLLAVGLVIALSGLIVHTIIRRQARKVASVLLVVVVLLLLAVGAIPTDRIETRYTFFLYPPAIILAMTALASWSGEWFGDRKALVLTSLVGLTLFALSEDFQPTHLAHVDSAEITFRIGMAPTIADHYYYRSDTPGAAKWLALHVHQNDIVLNSVPNVDEYYHRVDYFFLDAGDPRYETYACHGGTEDRWTQRPLLYTMDALRANVATGHRLFLIIYPSQTKTVLTEAKVRGWSAALAWVSVDGGINVIVLEA
jgi:hypothetical protein